MTIGVKGRKWEFVRLRHLKHQIIVTTDIRETKMEEPQTAVSPLLGLISGV